MKGDIKTDRDENGRSKSGLYFTASILTSLSLFKVLASVQ
jgi:hypothetical protein